MDPGSLVVEQIEAGNRFLREFEKISPVTVAFWLKESEESQWNLYLASDRFENGNVKAAYGELLRIAKAMNDPYLNPFQMELVGLSEPSVQAALEVYKGHPPKIPFHIRGQNFGGVAIEEVYLVKGPTGGYRMPSGREVLDQIIDREATYYQQHGRSPRKMKLPVLMAYDLSKCGRDEIGDMSGKLFKDGITFFEKEGLHGMTVEIVRDRNASLEFE